MRAKFPPNNYGGLQLTRKLGESIVLLVEGKIVEITLTACLTTEARLNFKAPPEVEIYRKEVLDAAQFKKN